MKPKIVRVKGGYDFEKKCEEARRRRVSRRLNLLVGFWRVVQLGCVLAIAYYCWKIFDLVFM